MKSDIATQYIQCEYLFRHLIPTSAAEHSCNCAQSVSLSDAMRRRSPLDAAKTNGIFGSGTNSRHSSAWTIIEPPHKDCEPVANNSSVSTFSSIREAYL